jgi:hypothetical protein
LRRALQQRQLTSHVAKFPSSAAFDVIDSVLSGSDAERKDAVKQANGVFAFTLKNKAGETESWHVDLKEAGRVGTGVGKPTGMNEPNARPLAPIRRLTCAKRF